MTKETQFHYNQLYNHECGGAYIRYYVYLAQMNIQFMSRLITQLYA